MQSCRVLIVEDENIVALDLCRRLNNLGYEIVGAAASADKAFRLIEKKQPDVILMDIRIKGSVDGIQVADSVHRDFNIPVIFLTAYSEEATLVRARATKPYGYLLKPFSERELHVAIQIALERHRADCQLQKSETHLKLALNAANLGTWEMQSRDAPITIGHTPAEPSSAKADWTVVSEAITACRDQLINHQLDKLRQHNDAEVSVEFAVGEQTQGQHWLTLYGKSFSGDHARPRAVGIIQDVTERHQTEEKLKQAAMVFRCSGDGIVILDSGRHTTNFNQAFTRITGYQLAELKGRELPLLSADALGENRYRELWHSLAESGSWQGEARGYDRERKPMDAWVNIGSVPDQDGSASQYVVVISDISAIRSIQEELSRIAYYDSLTKLPNRNLFMDRLTQALAKSKRDQKRLAILYIDLDHFKRVNDTLGHQVGDAMLRAVAQRLRRDIRATDTLCRIGGDEFIVIMESPHQLHDLETLAKKLLSTLNKPLLLGNTEVVPGGSIGISLYPEDAREIDDLIKMADTAMYSAKNNGRNRFVFYRPEMTASTLHYLTRESEIRLAIQGNQLRLYFQPQFKASDNTLVGIEALLRWQHPEQGLLSAGEIIPIAEGSSLIVDIGHWVIEECCRQIRNWLDQGLEPPRVSLNLSVRHLQDSSIIEFIKAALADKQLHAGYLEVEVTESCLQDNESCLLCLKEMERMGIRISIDDFGTGYSCMSSLKTLPIHRLKIDQAFVREIPRNGSDTAIARAIIALGQQLNLKVIAEGIETEEQADFMRRAGCHELQGFLLGHPVPADQLALILPARATPEGHRPRA